MPNAANLQPERSSASPAHNAVDLPLPFTDNEYPSKNAFFVDLHLLLHTTRFYFVIIGVCPSDVISDVSFYFDIMYPL